MPWTSALRYAKAHFALASGAEAQADAAAPLGARVGGLLRYQRAPLIRARAAGSLFDMPAQEQDVVRAISHVRLDLSGSAGAFSHRHRARRADAKGATDLRERRGR